MATTSTPSDSLFAASYRRATLTISSGFAIVAFAALALGTVMPVAVRDLDGLPQYALVFSGFLVAGVVGTALAGGITDRVGPVPVIWAGLTCFTVGAVLSGAAGSVWTFVAGRVVQGAGGGAVTVALIVVVARAYPEHLRPRMFSLTTACWILPSLLGPPIAGAVADWLSWRWVFHLTALLTLAVLVWQLLSRPLNGLPEPQEENAPPARPPMLAALAVAAGAALVQYALSPHARVPFLLAAAGLTVLVLSARRLFPPRTLRAGRGLPALVLVRGAAAAAYFAVESYLPLLLIDERGLPPIAAGSVLLGAAVCWAGASWVQSRPRLRPHRQRVLLTGALVHLLGTAVALGGTTPGTPTAVAAAGLVLCACGMGVLLPGIGVLALEYSSPAEQGTNSAALQLADSLCSMLLIGVCGAAFNMVQQQTSSDGTAFAAVFALAVAAALVACPLVLRIGRPRERTSTLTRPRVGRAS
ncbi:MFS transporter [Streptomyces sp. NPDC127098]|uniref:MFS transporter n=1 Tax=Streptomyces sp. NPDC127098 TaxID=3347137 RepID=UPI003657C554